MKELLAELREAILQTSFASIKMPESDDAKNARAYHGHANGWRTLVVTWEHPTQEGFAGTATKSGTGKVVRLTTELAKLAVERAEQ